MNSDLHRFGIRRLDNICEGQSLYLLGDEGILYSQKQNRFAGLDAAGILAYRAFAAGATIEDLSAFNTPSRTAGLLETADQLEMIYALSQDIFPSEMQREEWPPLKQSVKANIDIHGIPVLLQCPEDDLGAICRDYFLTCPPTEQPAEQHFYAKQVSDNWTIYVNDYAFMFQLHSRQLGLGFLHATRSLLYAKANYDVAFHAAMVADGNRGIMLCAPREAGKSTLTAALVADGFHLLTDEPALLHLDTNSVSALPFPISVKEGSWEVLAHRWPQLISVPIHVRSDGMKTRLLHPPAVNRSTQLHRITHLVFPEYRPSSSTIKVDELSPFRTLCLLNEGGMLFSDHFSNDKFEKLLQLLCTVPTSTMQYSSLESAVDTIRQLS